MAVPAARHSLSTPALPMRFDRYEAAGAVADVGVLVPIAAALIIKNGLAATAVLLPAGLLYIAVAFAFRLPIPVQPLKAFGAIAIAMGLGASEIAAGSLLMGAIFLALGATGLIDVAGRAFPKPLIRGVQLTVGLLFLKIAWGLAWDAPSSFADAGADPVVLVALTLVVLGAAFALRRHLIALVLVLAGLGIALARAGSDLKLGPSAIPLPDFDAAVFASALVALVIPQLPLTFANSCLATADAARGYFGERAERVKPGRLAMSLGAANLLAGGIAGMPVCHGAGGLTAHERFGARTGGAPLMMGIALLVLALGFGAGVGEARGRVPGQSPGDLQEQEPDGQ
ncbi:MAG: putative sulfate/molybdate transporter, partial [Solirubrobacterales bacterium]